MNFHCKFSSQTQGVQRRCCCHSRWRSFCLQQVFSRINKVTTGNHYLFVFQSWADNPTCVPSSSARHNHNWGVECSWHSCWGEKRTLHLLTHHISYLITIDHISTRSWLFSAFLEPVLATLLTAIGGWGQGTPTWTMETFSTLNWIRWHQTNSSIKQICSQVQRVHCWPLQLRDWDRNSHWWWWRESHHQGIQVAYPSLSCNFVS